jgi:translation initiation factor 1
MSKKNKNSNPVYSTAKGRLCPDCGKPASQCKCSQVGSKPDSADGIVRLRREVKGRRGKTVTTVYGIPHNPQVLLELAGEIKKRCGAGGSVKDGVVVIQGDHRQTLKRVLEEKGYTVKIAGG